MDSLLAIVGIFLTVWALFWLCEVVGRANLYTELKPRLDKLDEFSRELEKQSRNLDAVRAALGERERAVILLSQQKAVGFPWLAEAYAEFFELLELKRASVS